MYQHFAHTTITFNETYFYIPIQIIHTDPDTYIQLYIYNIISNTISKSIYVYNRRKLRKRHYISESVIYYVEDVLGNEVFLII